MPFFNLVFWSAFCVLVAVSARPVQAETKRVCHTDSKTKKEVCKNIKVHKKVEGTKVPEPTKKKK
jgi:hypothetical protein